MLHLKAFLCIVFIQFVSSLYSQTGNAAVDKVAIPPYTYRSAENPYYWKNSPPYAGYWQQDVHYSINAEIDDSSDIISGSLTLTYYNNSPDTLPFVYFHLYQEAFQPGSYAHELSLVNKNDPHFGKYETEGLGTEINSVYVKNINGFPTDKSVELIQDNTILKVNLQESILPGGSMTFQITFKTYFDNGDIRRRMKLFNAFGYKHYDGVHWYPRICVYDKKSGWNTDQHLGKEFYGDFGIYEVSLTFPHEYIVDATGVLINPETAMPKSLREKLDIRNFEDKEWESSPSIIIEKIPGEKKYGNILQ
ncbi:MAG: hypothetical protein H7Y00_12750 [Fimbriimonadaceae bacterium]|nr:hypothetical protein [Chitinophagales bacterium]